MKKLLMKWFPKYFKITNLIDLDKIEVMGHPYKLAKVDPDSKKTFDTLGIPEARLFELYKEVKVQMIQTSCRIETMINMEPKIKHINEFYACVLFMEKEASRMNGPAGLLEMLIRGQGGPSGGDGE